MSGVLLVIGILAGCGQSKKDDHLTVYLWENRLMKNIAPYIHEQFPDQDIEFIIGNNDTDLYSYFKEHGELPDIMTVRRFSGTDAQDLQPYLMDFASYDVVSKYYSYAVEYYKDTDNEIQWLPICALPQTIIANKTLFDQYGIKVPENYEEYVQVCQQFYDKGIKPYSMNLAEDWANQEIIQAAAIGEFTSLAASGMKIIVKNEENGFSLKDITINDKKIDTEKEYSILLTDTTKSILKKINPKCAIEQIGDTTLSSAWIAAMSNGQQPSAPEDYIEVEKKSANRTRDN